MELFGNKQAQNNQEIKIKHLKNLSLDQGIMKPRSVSRNPNQSSLTSSIFKRTVFFVLISLLILLEDMECQIFILLIH